VEVAATGGNPRVTKFELKTSQGVVEFFKEASQRRLASHTKKHDLDTHGDQPRKLIIQSELTSKQYWARLKTIAVKELHASTRTAIQKHI
jgi:hypothetical protein